MQFTRGAHLLIVLVFLNACSNTETTPIDKAAYIHSSIDNVTEVIIHDIFSPPVASRIYTYSNIAAYEANRHADSSLQSLVGQIAHMPQIPEPKTGKQIDFDIAGIVAFNLTAKKFIFSEDSINGFYNKFLTNVKASGLDEDVINNSVEYGTAVSDVIKKWADGDNYAQSRSFPKFEVTNDSTRWRPTPPAYMDAIEPHWNKIRSFTLDSAAQFKPAKPTPFNMKKGSKFYQEVVEVYDSVRLGSDEMKQIANFWDCNPYKMNVIGHVMHASKKITPGGHWIGIAGICARKAKLDPANTWKVYTMVSLGLMDGFISCWDEKYRSKLIRPESIINKYIDETWSPLLQTPPFPEYTSGHSVVSGASSIILTSIFGDNFNFDDDTEVRFGLPIRSFTSFKHAAEEASISRLYGGIHYRTAITNGLNQGQQIGQWVVSKIKLKK